MASNGGGENLPKVAFYIFLYSTVVTLLMTYAIAFTGATVEQQSDDFFGANQSIQRFTGDSVTSYVGWTLDGVYTAGNYNTQDEKGNNVWVSGDDVSDAWFIAGSTLGGKDVYPNGITSALKQSVGDQTDKQPYDPIRLSANQKSSIHLQWQNESVKYTSRDVSAQDWIKDPFNSALKLIVGEEGVKNLYYWYYTGWRYQFSPVAQIQADNMITNEVKLNIVWYSNPEQRYDESIDAGFLIYAEDSDNYVSYIDSVAMSDIIKGYDVGSSNASKYSFNFNGNIVYMFIKFDQGITNTMSIQQAFSEGYWTVQFASPVVSISGNTDTTSFTQVEITSGQIAETINAMVKPWDSTLIPAPWSWVMWVFVTVPSALVIGLLTLRLINSILP